MINEILFIAEAAALVICARFAVAHSFGASVAWASMQLILANLCIRKTIELFGATATGGEVFIVSSMCTFSLIQDFYGVAAARKTIIYCFFSQVLFALLGYIHGIYIPASGSEEISTALSFVIALAPRLLVASLIAYFVSERIHLFLLQHTGNRFVALFCGQLVDTSIMTFLGLWGTIANPYELILVCMAIKTLMLIAVTPLLVLMRRSLSVSVLPEEDV